MIAICESKDYLPIGINYKSAWNCKGIRIGAIVAMYHCHVIYSKTFENI